MDFYRLPSQAWHRTFLEAVRSPDPEAYEYLRLWNVVGRDYLQNVLNVLEGITEKRFSAFMSLDIICVKTWSIFICFNSSYEVLTLCVNFFHHRSLWFLKHDIEHTVDLCLNFWLLFYFPSPLGGEVKLQKNLCRFSQEAQCTKLSTGLLHRESQTILWSTEIS